MFKSLDLVLIYWHTSLCCVLQLKQFQKDNEEVGFGSASTALQQAIEKTTARIAWLAENKKQVLKWFNSETLWPGQHWNTPWQPYKLHSHQLQDWNPWTSRHPSIFTAIHYRFDLYLIINKDGWYKWASRAKLYSLKKVKYINIRLYFFIHIRCCAVKTVDHHRLEILMCVCVCVYVIVCATFLLCHQLDFLIQCIAQPYSFHHQLIKGLEQPVLSFFSKFSSFTDTGLWNISLLCILYAAKSTKDCKNDCYFWINIFSQILGSVVLLFLMWVTLHKTTLLNTLKLAIFVVPLCI